MKSMFVVSPAFINKHVGEEYDVILEVVDEPTTQNIQTYAEKINGRIKELWAQQEGSEDRKVVVHLHAATPFAAMLVNLQIILKAQNGIIIELPWEKEPDIQQLDAESRVVLRRLETK